MICAFKRAYQSIRRQLLGRPTKATVQVDEVIDGESFQLTQRYDGFLNVRIAGIRAPAIDEDNADWAADTLSAMIAGKACVLQPVDEDPDGFLVANVMVDDFDVGQQMVERGHAIRSDTLFRGVFRRADQS